MTTPIAYQVEQRKRRRSRDLRSMPGDMVDAIAESRSLAVHVRWPSDKYRLDPVSFCHDILGVEPWEKQVEILNAVRDHKRVAVTSGHKTGKSASAAMIALWFYCSFPDARVVMTSTTSRQVDQILWRELRMIRARGGRCLACKRAELQEVPCDHSALIDGEQGELARTGLKSKDFREVTGFTAREAEAVAGISGRNLLYIPDEASGIDESIFEAIEGNRAGGARIVMFSNPTKNEGEFFEAFHGKRDFYKTISISSEETPNAKEGRDVVPGLAGRAWIDEKKEEWGEQSALYKVRVKGEFATREDGKIFSIHTIGAAEERWAETPEAGRLYIGLDPAGPTGSGDETVFAIRRGMKLLALHAMRGLSDDQHVVQVQLMVAKYKVPRETPVVVLDREGVGAPIYSMLRNFIESSKAFELVPVRASDKAHRQPNIYDRMRDELSANLEAWFRDGGAIPEDVKLAAELHQPEWKQQVNGRLKVTPKEVIRKALGRSPDRYDALALSCWEPLALQEDAPAGPAGRATDGGGGAPTLDPYAPAMDPYGAMK